MRFTLPFGRTLVVCALALAAQLSGRPARAAATEPWPQLSDAQQQAAVGEMKQFAQEARDKLGVPMGSAETKYFLFVSDLPPREAQQWAGLLDRMYERLSEMFAVPAGKNIWRGKALIYVFSRKQDYQRYEKEIMHTDAGTTDGMCHSSGNGNVRIAFRRQEDPLEFAHVLVHESVHGFLHRYRSHAQIPSWANEGLAETIATDLVPRNGHRDDVRRAAVANLESHRRNLGDFFTTDHIADWQYPVAQMLTTMMLEASKSNYVDFINGLKDGLPYEESLRLRYKAPRERLVPVFGNWLGVRGVR